VRFRDLALTPFTALPAPPRASIACQSEWDHANREEYAERQHHPQPIGVHRCLLVSVNAIDHSGGLPEPNSCARLARLGAGPEKSGSRHKKPRQPGVTLKNATNCKKFLAGAGLLEGISYWNHQIFCVNWGCFISPQGSHALCNGKIRGTPMGIKPEET
jgi:hypothetical protein